MASSSGAEVVVVGGGAIGCAIAWRLAQAGHSVALIERGAPGGEASSAAAGILGAQMETHAAGPMLALLLASRALHPAMAEELRDAAEVDVRCRIEGVLELAFGEEEERELRRRFDWQTQAGLRAEWLLPQRLAEQGVSPRAVAGLFFPDDGQVDNRRLAAALHIAAKRAGASIIEATVSEVVEEGGRVAGVRVLERESPSAVRLVDRLIAAERVVIAAGSWSALLPGASIAEGAVRPVRGQMIALKPLPGLGARVLACSSGYAVPREERLLVGATVEEVGFLKINTAAGIRSLLQTAERLLPGSSDSPILESWSGLRPASRDGLPLLGAPARGPEGLLVCTGHHRNGILLTPISAELIRDAVAGRPAAHELAPFRPDRF